MYLGSRVLNNVKHSFRNVAVNAQRSTRWCSSKAIEKGDKDVISSEQESQVSAETADGRPLKNVPFGKNLFLGKIDPEHFVFPEIDNNEELDELNQMVEPIEKYFVNDLDSKSIDQNAKIPEETLQQLKDFGLFGQQIPVEYGGLGLNATKYARIAEATSHDGAVGVTLAAHQAIGLKGLLIAGTDAQKEKYLPRLATGELVAAFCLTEPSSGSDAASIQTKAELNEEGTHYLLNGSKIWISNGGIADVFTVFAKSSMRLPDGTIEAKVTAFFVERNFGGVTNGKPEDKLGIRGSNTCEVYFDNTPVPLENIIGEVGGGFKIAMNILNSGRFSMGSSGAGTLKRLIAMAAEHATSRSQFGSKLKDFGLIQEKFARMSTTCYAMESMAYMTAGVMDNYQDPDASVEAAMVKVFSSEGCWTSINEILQIFGGLGYMKDYPYERYLRDARILQIFEGTNEILRLFISLTCLQHTGKELKDMVKKMSNPFNNMNFLVKKTIERIRKKKLDLSDRVHPSIASAAECLDERVVKLQYEVENQLSIYKNEIVNEQMVLKRLSDIAIDMYAVTACLARASRSYSIGLRNCEHEGLLTSAFTNEAIMRIDQNLLELNTGKWGNGDEQLRKISENVFKHGGYVPEHPLSRNW